MIATEPSEDLIGEKCKVSNTSYFEYKRIITHVWPVVLLSLVSYTKWLFIRMYFYQSCERQSFIFLPKHSKVNTHIDLYLWGVGSTSFMKEVLRMCVRHKLGKRRKTASFSYFNAETDDNMLWYLVYREDYIFVAL